MGASREVSDEETLVWQGLGSWGSPRNCRQATACGRIKERDGSEFEIAPVRSHGSPLGCQGVDLDLSTEETCRRITGDSCGEGSWPAARPSDRSSHQGLFSATFRN